MEIEAALGYGHTCYRLNGALLRREVKYGVTSLGRERASAKQLNDWLRGHWQIENGLHERRDKTLGEDGCRTKKGRAGQVLTTMNNLVLGLILGVAGKANMAARREYQARPALALALLTS